jgi:hypothetical protein
MDREIWIEKLTEFLPSHMLNYENHTNDSFAQSSTSIHELERYCEIERLNFLGIAIPPYNPYGEDYNYAAVFEKIENDYEVIWHHCSKKWINRFLFELGHPNI